MLDAFFWICWFIIKWTILLPFYALYGVVQLIRFNLPEYRTPVRAPKPRTRPSTPQETMQAETMMRTAHAFLQDFYGHSGEVDKSIALLGKGSNALNKARALDPGVSITVEEDKKQISYTIDELASALLFAEAQAYLLGIDDLQSDRHEVSGKWARTFRSYQNGAIDAAQKALIYAPKSPQHLRLLARAYRASNKKRKAKAVLNEALAINPNDVETLKMMQ